MRLYSMVFVLAVVIAIPFGAVAQPKGNDINTRIEELIVAMKNPQNVRTRDELGIELTDLVRSPDAANINPATIDDMAALLADDDLDLGVKVPIVRAFEEIGPAANRAVPALQRAAEQDLSDILATSGGILSGGEALYEAAMRAIRKIRGEPPQLDRIQLPAR